MNEAEINKIILEAEGLSKSFIDKVILEDINFKVNEGEAVVIIGPSGVGKTTLLRCLILLEKPDSGRISIGDVEINIDNWEAINYGTKNRLPKFFSATDPLKNIILKNGDTTRKLTQEELQKLRLNCGIVFQQYNLWPNKTALQNITEALIIVKKLSSEDAVRKANLVAEELGVSDKLNLYPNQLSGGQQQRIAIARTLAMEPEIFLFDEITSALDVEVVAEILNVLKKIRMQKKKTMIFVSHHIEFVKAVADRVFFLDDKHLFDCGNPLQAFTSSSNTRLNEFLSSVKQTH